MRRLEKKLVVGCAVALVSMLIVTLVMIALMQYALLGELMTKQGTAFRIAKATRGFLASSTILIVSFGLLSLWIGKLVSRYVAERDRLRVAKDMKLAADIQLGAMPQTFPPFPDVKSLDVYATMHPARDVGGDFYDFGFDRSGRLVFLVADVSGKGVPAALFMMRAKALLKNYVQSGTPLAEAVSRTNDALCEGNTGGLFVTCWIGLLDTATGIVKYVNAGHNRPILRHAANRRADWVADEPCLFLGAIAGTHYVARKLRLSPGDSLYLYTDGITEQIDPDEQLYGDDRLLALMRGTDATQKDLLARVTRAVTQHAGEAEQFDDRTQLEVVWRGQPVAHQHDYPPTEDGVVRASADLDAALRTVPFDDRTVILTAADEIYANIIRHSGATRWSMRIERCAFPDEVRLVFTDDGRPFDPLKVKAPDVSVPPEQRASGGLGIFIVRSTMTAVSYAWRDGHNVLSLCKKIGTVRAPSPNTPELDEPTQSSSGISLLARKITRVVRDLGMIDFERTKMVKSSHK